MTRTNAIVLVLLGGVFMSFAGLMLRYIEDASGMQVLVYRSFALAMTIPAIACWRRGIGLMEFLRSLNRQDCVMAVLMCGAFSFYVYSILTTSVASTLFILAFAPFVAAVVGWGWIGERPQQTTVFAMVVALFGVGLMVFDGLGTGQWLGNVMALLAASCFAVALVYVRRTGAADMLGGTFLGGLLASVVNVVLVLALGQGLILSANDLAISISSGVLTIGIGMALVIWGASWLPAAEVSVLVLIESVLGPLWVWLVFSESVSARLLIGGAIVLAAVVGQAWFSRPKRQINRAFRFGPAGSEARPPTE